VRFRKSEAKRASEAAEQAEIDRLKALRPEALAAEILPVMGSGAVTQGLRGVTVHEIIKGMGLKATWTVNTGLLLLPVREALQRLEHANLVIQMASGVDHATHWRITSAGEESLAAGDVAQRLGIGAAG
jgi:hypothetical protein